MVCQLFNFYLFEQHIEKMVFIYSVPVAILSNAWRRSGYSQPDVLYLCRFSVSATFKQNIFLVFSSSFLWRILFFDMGKNNNKLHALASNTGI